MEFNKIVNLIFQAAPEFEEFYKEDLNEDYYNTFLGDFALFTRDAVKNGESYALKYLYFINHVVNRFPDDKDFINKMIINVLEILTDYEVTQRASRECFDGYCLVLFDELFTSGQFIDLLTIPKW